MRHFLDFEKPLAELEGKIDELRQMSAPDGVNIADEVGRLTEKADKQLRATYAKRSPISGSSSPTTRRSPATGPLRMTKPSSADWDGSKAGRSS
jgi:acetyl-CoA carboxylase alpha subunit